MSSQAGTVSDRTQMLVHPTIGRIKGVKKSSYVVEYLGLQYATLEDAFARGKSIAYASRGDGDSIIDATQHG